LNLSLFLAEIPGFLRFVIPSRASLMLDVVFLAMFLVVPVLIWSIVQVRAGRFQIHKWTQLTLGSVLLLAVIAFELDMRFFTDWELLAEDSAYYKKGTWDAVWISLVVHLCFAIPATLLWIAVIALGLKNFPVPPAPGQHSRFHRRLGYAAAFAMIGTAITGWVFYVLSFVA
jgi:putative membrane protein